MKNARPRILPGSGVLTVFGRGDVGSDERIHLHSAALRPRRRWCIRSTIATHLTGSRFASVVSSLGPHLAPRFATFLTELSASLATVLPKLASKLPPLTPKRTTLRAIEATVAIGVEALSQRLSAHLASPLEVSTTLVPEPLSEVAELSSEFPAISSQLARTRFGSIRRPHPLATRFPRLLSFRVVEPAVVVLIEALEEVRPQLRSPGSQLIARSVTRVPLGTCLSRPVGVLSFDDTRREPQPEAQPHTESQREDPSSSDRCKRVQASSFSFVVHPSNPGPEGGFRMGPISSGSLPKRPTCGLNDTRTRPESRARPHRESNLRKLGGSAFTGQRRELPGLACA